MEIRWLQQFQIAHSYPPNAQRQEKEASPLLMSFYRMKTIFSETPTDILMSHWLGFFHVPMHINHWEEKLNYY